MHDRGPQLTQNHAKIDGETVYIQCFFVHCRGSIFEIYDHATASARLKQTCYVVIVLEDFFRLHTADYVSEKFNQRLIDLPNPVRSASFSYNLVAIGSKI